MSEDKKIAERAYDLWVKAGKPQGREKHFYYEAEKQIAAEESSGGDTFAWPELNAETGELEPPKL